MKAAVVRRFGGPDVLRIMEIPEPTPEPGQILLRVRAIGLNFADVFARFGVYPNTPKPPFVPGAECSGIVVRIGEGVSQFRVGERVMGFPRLGSHAEYVALKAEYAIAIPETMTYEEGAGFLATGITAYHALVRLANLRRGERLLVHAAAGGVGIATVQLGRSLGAEVIATAGTEEKLNMARQYGAHHAINYSTADFAEEVLRFTAGHGADVIVDSVGGKVFRKGWNILAPMGRYVILGVSGIAGRGGMNYVKAAWQFLHMLPVLPGTFIGANKALMGFNLATLKGAEAYLRQAADEILRFYSEGTLKPVVGKVFPFEEIVEAHRYLQTRRSKGKVVVSVPMQS